MVLHSSWAGWSSCGFRFSIKLFSVWICAELVRSWDWRCFYSFWPAWWFRWAVTSRHSLRFQWPYYQEHSGRMEFSSMHFSHWNTKSTIFNSSSALAAFDKRYLTPRLWCVDWRSAASVRNLIVNKVTYLRLVPCIRTFRLTAGTSHECLPLFKLIARVTMSHSPRSKELVKFPRMFLKYCLLPTEFLKLKNRLPVPPPCGANWLFIMNWPLIKSRMTLCQLSLTSLILLLLLQFKINLLQLIFHLLLETSRCLELSILPPWRMHYAHSCFTSPYTY